MKKNLLCLSFLLATSSAIAADLPMRGAPPAVSMLLPANVPVFTWAGVYVGAQAGYGRQRDRNTESPLCLPCAIDIATGIGKGALGGVHAGVNWQAAAFVFGMEADLELTNVRHTTVYPLSAPDSFGSRTPWQGSVRGRVGYAFDRLLIYATGGLAIAEIKHSYNLTPPPAFTSETISNVRSGWTVGAGVEYAFTNRWSARLEYRYTDFGRWTDMPTLFASAFNEKHRETQQAVRAGVSYRF